MRRHAFVARCDVNRRLKGGRGHVGVGIRSESQDLRQDGLCTFTEVPEGIDRESTSHRVPRVEQRDEQWDDLGRAVPQNPSSLVTVPERSFDVPDDGRQIRILPVRRRRSRSELRKTIVRDVDQTRPDQQ